MLYLARKCLAVERIDYKENFQKLMDKILIDILNFSNLRHWFNDLNKYISVLNFLI